MKYQDYYKTLDVQRDASAEDIRKAYRSLARKYHPDVNRDADAGERFKAITEAYEVLKDPEKRKLYDSLGPNWKSGQDFRPPPGWSGQGAPRGRPSAHGVEEGFGGFSDFFEQIFGAMGGQGVGGMGGMSGMGGGMGGSPFGRSQAAGRARPMRGRDVESQVTISLIDAHHGATRTLEMTLPDGGTRRLDVRIPRGTTDGAVMRLRGQGSPGIAGGEPGDVRLRVRVAPDPRFTLDGHDLTHKLELSVAEAVLGARKAAPTIDGEVTVTIPPGTQPGAKLRVRGHGMNKRADGERGDLYIVADVKVPKSLSDEERALYEQLAQLANPNNAPA